MKNNLKRLVEMSPDIICITDINGDIIEISHKIYSLLKYNEKENSFIGKNIMNFVHEEDLERSKKEILKTLHKNNEEEQLFRIQDSEKQNIYVEISGKTIQEDEKTLIILAIRECTQKIQQEQKLTQMINDMKKTSLAFYWEVDSMGYYTEVSEKVLAILGYHPKEMIGKSPFDFMPKAEALEIKHTFSKAMQEEKEIIMLENWNRHKNGSLICLSTNGKPFFN